MRVMRRRLDLPDWGFDAEPARGGGGSGVGDVVAVAAVAADEAERAPLDYRTRARFLIGHESLLGRREPQSLDGVEAGADADSNSDSDSEGGRVEGAAVDPVEGRRRIAQLERAADELRRGIAEDADPERRREAERDLEESLRALALLRTTRAANGAAADAGTFVPFGRLSGLSGLRCRNRSGWGLTGL